MGLCSSSLVAPRGMPGLSSSSVSHPYVSFSHHSIIICITDPWTIIQYRTEFEIETNRFWESAGSGIRADSEQLTKRSMIEWWVEIETNRFWELAGSGIHADSEQLTKRSMIEWWLKASMDVRRSISSDQVCLWDVLRLGLQNPIQKRICHFQLILRSYLFQFLIRSYIV